MNCNIARDQLSGLLDKELSPQQSAEIQQHLAGCESCAHELATFRKIGELSSLQTEPVSPPLAWEVLAKRLDESGQSTTLATRNTTDTYTSGIAKTPFRARSRSRNWKLFAGGLVALAASLLVFASLRPQSIEMQSSETHSATATAVDVATMNLQPLLEQLPHDAQQKLNQLTSQLTATEVAIEQADKTFGRATFVSTAFQRHSLPGEAKITATKILSFPSCKCLPGQCECSPGGCNCVACICQRPDGSTYLVLEHCQSQAVSFGDLPVRLASMLSNVASAAR